VNQFKLPFGVEGGVYATAIALPKEYRKGYFEDYDRTFLLILLASFVFHFSIIIYFTINPLPTHVQQSSLRRAQEDLARLIIPEPMKEKQAFVARPSASMPTETEQPQQRTKTKTSTSKQQQRITGSQLQPSGEPGEQGQPPSNDVSSVGVLALLGTTSDRGREDVVADILGEGAQPTQDLDKALAQLDRLNVDGKRGGGKTTATAADRRARGGRTTTQENLDGMLSDLGAAKSTSLSREREIIALDLSPLTHDEGEEEQRAVLVGARNPEDITRIVNAHKPALQYCYQRELKRNPNLRGKMVVRFTITPKGTVRDVKILSSTLKSEHVERCVISRISRWDDFGQIDPALGDATFRQVYSFGY